MVTPAPLRLNNGNRITALRWAALLKKLGHRVRITQKYDERRCDVLIALHARRSADSIRRFHELHPEFPLIVGIMKVVAPAHPDSTADLNAKGEVVWECVDVQSVKAFPRPAPSGTATSHPSCTAVPIRPR